MDNPVMKVIKRHKLVAIIRLPDLTHGISITRALLAGGVRAVEFTMTSPDAPRAIANVLAAMPEFSKGEAVIGAGSVNEPHMVDIALEAGAQFIVAPTIKPAVIEAAQSAGVPVMPGAYTPTEIETAWEMGVDVVKVFPARNLGPDYIKDVLAPLPHLRLMPTGGVDVNNIGAYVKNGAFAVGVGSGLVDKSINAAKDWKAVVSAAKQFVAAMG